MEKRRSHCCVLCNDKSEPFQARFFIEKLDFFLDLKKAVVLCHSFSSAGRARFDKLRSRCCCNIRNGGVGGPGTVSLSKGSRLNQSGCQPCIQNPIPNTAASTWEGWQNASFPTNIFPLRIVLQRVHHGHDSGTDIVLELLQSMAHLPGTDGQKDIIVLVIRWELFHEPDFCFLNSFTIPVQKALLT